MLQHILITVKFLIVSATKKLSIELSVHGIVVTCLNGPNISQIIVTSRQSRVTIVWPDFSYQWDRAKQSFVVLIIELKLL